VAARTLRALVEAGHAVEVVVTRPDKRRGRGSALSPSPVKAVAQELGLPVAYQPAAVASSGAELGVVVAYGRIVRPEVLARVPMVNLHFSLLPRWRGAAPLERALLAGDKETGVCVMKLEEGLDTGPVYRCEKVDIGETETAEELRWRLGELGTAMVLDLLAEGLPEPVPQAGEPTYAPKLEPAERQLDFTLPSELLMRVIRVGKAWTKWRGKRFIVHRAERAGGGSSTQFPLSSPQVLAPGELAGDLVGTGDWPIRLVEVQPEGKARMPAEDWLRGARPRPHERLGA